MAINGKRGQLRCFNPFALLTERGGEKENLVGVALSNMLKRVCTFVDTDVAQLTITSSLDIDHCFFTKRPSRTVSTTMREPFYIMKLDIEKED